MAIPIGIKYLDIQGLAEQLGLSVQTLYRWRSEGVDMPQAFRVGSRLRWSQTVVDEWLTKKEGVAA